MCPKSKQMEISKVVVVNSSAAQVITMVKNAVSKSPTGVSFLSVRYYTNKNGETSHYSINFGAKYENAVARDIEFLRNVDVTTMTWKSPMIEIFKAKEALLASFEQPDKVRSDAQKDTYEHISKGLKVHNETGALYVYGYLKSKKILIKGEYKTVNSSAQTIAKDEIRKHLRTGKFRMFVLDSFHVLKSNGKSLFIDYPPIVLAIN